MRSFFITLILHFLFFTALFSSCEQEIEVERQKYSITFESNGGSPVAEQSVFKDETLSRPSPPSKEEHTFVGWYTDKNSLFLYDFSSPVKSSFTLYAKWLGNQVKVKKFVATLNNTTLIGNVTESDTIKIPFSNEDKSVLMDKNVKVAITELSLSPGHLRQKKWGIRFYLTLKQT